MNLLPPEEKNFLNKEEKIKRILVLEIIFLFFIIFLFLCLLTVQILLRSDLDAQKIIFEIDLSAFEDSGYGELKDKVDSLGQDIEKINTFYNEQISLTDVKESIADLLPRGVYLTRFSWKKQDRKVELAGFSPQRDYLFDLQRRLNENSDFENIDFPQSNWIKPNNIDFSASFTPK